MYVIYHNPRCRKSRETLEILNEHGISEEKGNLKIILYLENPPTKATLKELASLLNFSPIEFTRTKEDKFKEIATEKGATVSDEEMYGYMHAYPILIERPIVVKTSESDPRAVLGRPPENVLSLI